jgi:preprotein translocase subunit SecF
MFKKFTERYIDFIKKHHIAVLSIYLVITLCLGYLGTKIGMKSDFIDLLSDKNKVIKNMKKVFKMYGGEGYLICTLEYNHDFYYLNSSFDGPDREYGYLFKTLDKWDPNDKVSTTKYLPFLLNHIRLVNANQAALINTLGSGETKLKTPKGKKYFALFKKDITTAFKELNDLSVLMSKAGNDGIKMLSLLKKHFSTENPDSVYELFKAKVNKANSLYNNIKETIKNEFSNEKALKKASDLIAARVLKENPEDVRFVSYRQPVKWLKNNFFYLIESRDLTALHQELKKIHLSSVRVLGESKFQGVRNILNKYSVSLDESDDEEEVATQARAANTGSSAPQAQKSTSSKDYKYNLNKTKDMLILLIKPMGRSSNLDYSRELIAKIRKVLKEIDFAKIDKNITTGLTGRYVKKVEDADTLSRDIKVTSLVATALIILFILVYFRRIRAVVATMIPLLSGLMWALGIVYLAVGYFNIITGFIVAILTGLGIDFGIHLLARYYEERKEGNDSAESLKRVFKTTLRGTITAATTTAFAFLCLIVTEFKGFSQFGYTIFLGLMFILLAMFVSFPCILIISERLFPINVDKLKRGKEESLSRLKGKKFPYPYAVLAVGLVITVVSFFFLPRFDFNFSNLRDTSNISIQLDKKISASFKVSLWPSIVYTGDPETTREISESLRRRAKYSRELVDLLRAFHFTNFVKNISKHHEIYKAPRVTNEAYDFLHRMRCEVSVGILSDYIKSVTNDNFKAKKAYLKTLIDNYRLRLKSNYVVQYLTSLAAETASEQAPSGSASARGEENEENFNLDVPNETSTISSISAKDKKKLEAFFDILATKNIGEINKILKKPYDYRAILKASDKLIKALKNNIYKSKDAIDALFAKIKSTFLIDKDFQKSKKIFF